MLFVKSFLNASSQSRFNASKKEKECVTSQSMPNRNATTNHLQERKNPGTQKEL
jgi:hypothetical protein